MFPTAQMRFQRNQFFEAVQVYFESIEYRGCIFPRRASRKRPSQGVGRKKPFLSGRIQRDRAARMPRRFIDLETYTVAQIQAVTLPKGSGDTDVVEIQGNSLYFA